MQYTKLGNSDLTVSRICMGCMGFGDPARGQHSWTIGEAQTREIIKRGLELGVNFYDTAIAYQSGTSEQYVGRALRDFAKREDVVVATKFLPRTQDEIESGVSGQQHIENMINTSLHNLGMDYVDLYIYHMWDWNTPIEDIMDGLNRVVKAGKARYIGMKRIIALLTAIVFVLAFAGCSANNTQGKSEETKAEETTKAAVSASAPEASDTADETAAENNDTADGGKTLVVYFSATGTTKGVAEQIAGVTGAEIYEIAAAQPYSDDDLNYNDSNSRSTKEQNDKTARPEIGSEKISLDGYDKIFIGFPIWWGEEPRIMDTFVESYDFSGKTMIPFCTSASSGIGSSGDNLKANAGSGEWMEGRRFSADVSQAEIAEWVNSL